MTRQLDKDRAWIGETTDGVDPPPPSVHPLMIGKALLSPSQACLLLGIGRTKLYDLIAHGELTAVKIGRSTKLRHTDLLAFIDALPAVGGWATGNEK